jgi:hypothetical protein
MSSGFEKRPRAAVPLEAVTGDEVSLNRWLVSFASGADWYPVGEFVALDAGSAIDRAIEIFGSATDYRAEEIPRDAAPLPRIRGGVGKTARNSLRAADNTDLDGPATPDVVRDVAADSH